MPNRSSWETLRSRAGKARRLLLRDPLIPVAAAAMLGIVLGDGMAIQPSWIGGLTLLTLLFAIRRQFPGRFLLPALLAFAFAQSVATWSIRQFPLFPNLKNGETTRVRVEGIVVSDPTLIGSGEVRRCLVDVRKIGVAGQVWNCRHRVPVTVMKPPANFGYGQRIRFTGLLEPLDIQRSPGAFAPDRFYYRSAGAVGEITAQSGDPVRVIESGAGNPLIALALRSRAWIEHAITRGLEDDPETASVIKAMVLGAREDTPEEIEEQFRLSGAMHVFAVSGLHVGIFGAILWWILRGFRVPKRWAILVIIPAILFYAVVTGLRPSAIRAAVMGTIVLAGFAAERRPRLLNSLAFAALLILAVNTQQLFLPGFQLSFAVLASIALFADPLREIFQRPFQIDPLIPRRFVSRWRRGCDTAWEKISTGLGVSIAAWIGSAFFIAYYFQILTPVAIVANLVLVPLAFCVLGAATISTLVSVLGMGFLSAIINQANATMAQLTTFAAASFAAIPGGHLHVTPEAFKRPPGCRVTVLESGPGGISNLVSVYPGRFDSAHWLIDPGNPAGFSSRIQPLIRHYGINRFQAMVLSHGDFRHSGSAAMALRRFPVGALFESPAPNRSPSYPEIGEVLSETATVRGALARGDVVPIDAATHVEVLFPPGDHADFLSDADDQCLVLRLHHRDWRILFTFDAGFLTARRLEETGANLRADVWVKGWHSQDHQGFSEYLAQIQPDVIITTNRRFPAGQQMNERQQRLLEEEGITAYDLTETGAITITASKERLTLEPFVGGGATVLE